MDDKVRWQESQVNSCYHHDEYIYIYVCVCVYVLFDGLNFKYGAIM